MVDATAMTTSAGPPPPHTEPNLVTNNSSEQDTNRKDMMVMHTVSGMEQCYRPKRVVYTGYIGEAICPWTGSTIVLTASTSTSAPRCTPHRLTWRRRF